MLTYSQSTGKLTADGKLLALCYAGRENGINNPEMDHIKSTGPLPKGHYYLEIKLGTKLGPIVFKLNPSKGNVMKGRSAFYIHWDNGMHNMSASEGCIVPIAPFPPTNVFEYLKLEKELEVVG